jgi:hypothetical protein
MTNEQGDERRGAQQETSAEREAKKNPSNDQDPSRPAEGRDAPPAGPLKEGDRDLDSPWLGGG